MIWSFKLELTYVCQCQVELSIRVSVSGGIVNCCVSVRFNGINSTCTCIRYIGIDIRMTDSGSLELTYVCQYQVE